MLFRAELLINDLKWENKMLQIEIKEMCILNDRDDEGTDEVKELKQQLKTLKAMDDEGTYESKELKRELKKLKGSVASFELKCIALLSTVFSFLHLVQLSLFKFQWICDCRRQIE